MLRRIVSLGQQASEGDDESSMSPPPNDLGRFSDSKNPGGLAGVFKGLTGGRRVRSPPPSSTSLAAPLSAAAALSSTSVASALPPNEAAGANADAENCANVPRSLTDSLADGLEQLRNGALSERIEAAANLRRLVSTTSSDYIYAIWQASRDMIEAGKPPLARQAGWELLAECAKCGACSHLERREFFQTITDAANPDDFAMQLATLSNLAGNGRDLSGFEYDVFPVLTEWFDVAYTASKAAARKSAATARASEAGSSNGNGGSRSKGKTSGATPEEQNLSRLFLFTIEVLKYSSKLASDSAINGLLAAVLNVAMNTSTEDDLASCIAVLSTCVTFGAMPVKSLAPCVKVLSSIHCLVPKLQPSAWTVLANIFKSHHALYTVRILLDSLLKYPVKGMDAKEAIREVRGALVVLQRLMRKAGTPGFPAVPFAVLVSGLASVAKQPPPGPHCRIVISILQLINQLFDTGDGLLSPLLADEDWAPLLDVAAVCVKRSTPSQIFAGPDSRRTQQGLGGPGSAVAATVAADGTSQDTLNRESSIIIARIETLLRGQLMQRPEYTQRASCIAFLADVHSLLPDSGADLVLQYYQEYRCCFPSDPQWDANLRLVLDAFYANRLRSSIIRLHALKAAIEVHDVLELVDGAIDAPDAVPDLVRRILSRLSEERDTVILNHAVSFTVSIAASVDASLFAFILEALASIVKNDERRQALPLASSSSSSSPSAIAAPKSPIQPPMADRQDAFDQSTSNIATKGYVQIFMETMDFDASKAAKAFDALVGVAHDKRCPIDARLTAMKLLFRLRADWANRIFLVPTTDSESLAAVLLRTEASMDRKIAEDAAQQQQTVRQRPDPSGPSPPPINHATTSRAARGVSFSQAGNATTQDKSSSALTARLVGESKHRYHQLWSLPDPDALPKAPRAEASTVLFSHPWDQSTPDSLPLENGSLRREVGQAEIPREAEEPGEGEAGEFDAGPADAQEPLRPLVTLNMASWMEVVFELLTKGTNWELYSFALVHLPSQLSNHAVCRGAVPVILRIRAALCDQIRMNSSQEPPAATGLRRPDVQSCVLQILTMILSYHEYFRKQEGDDLVRTFIAGLTDKNPIFCVQALSICCYELPNATSKSLVTILQKMSQIITRPGVAMHILELLACLSRLPWLYSNFREDEFRIAFGVCFRYLQAVRDRRATARASANASSGSDQTMSASTSMHGPGNGGTGSDMQSSEVVHQQPPSASDDLPQYVYALAYHVVTFWFLALRLPDRSSYVNWIASRLFIDNDGRQINDEQAQITLDFMQRVAFSDADESAANEDDPEGEDAGDPASTRNWVLGNSLITIQLLPNKPGWAKVVKRQPSGTSYYTIRENLRPPPLHQARTAGSDYLAGSSGGGDSSGGVSVQQHAGFSVASNAILPSHLLAQLLAPVPQPLESPLRPILLPDDDAVARAFRAFDRNSTVDGHKVGVIYIGEGQTEEADILSNISGSADYVDFLNGLGTLVRLKGAKFNTQGLDREYDSDGEYTFCWRDRVTEMVFHVITQMPTNRQMDPMGNNKKRHIGNDYVNIIFNDSGLPFRFDTFPSDFNFVNIVITPESRASFVARRELSLQQQKEQEEEQERARQPASEQNEFTSPRRAKRAMPFYKVKVMSKPGFPEISPAAETKIISLKALPDFIRLLALNASVFSLVWANRQGGEHVSSWRNRLREINRLRERYGPSQPLSMSSSPPSTGVGAAGGAGGGGGVGGSSGGGAGVRDSFNSLRRSSMATFFTVASDPGSYRSSVHSMGASSVGATPTPPGPDGSEATALQSQEAFIDTLDFSKWA